MKYTTLPNTNIKVSKLCLGTMTFGNQNTEAEGHEQLDYAIDKGINFIDTAELYPVPATAETSGRTSEIVGTWLKKSGKREQVVLASKIAGTGDYTAHIRTNGFSKAAINEAIDLELKRLQTDYIDLYQLHWPERETNRFGVRTYTLDTQWEDNFNDILNSLDALVKQGKIKHIGISNENSWGTMRYLQESKTHNLPRIKTIQNAYSLLTRSFETDLAEVSLREHVGLLAYSPMAFGVLSGKYIKGTAEDNARLKLFPRFSRYSGVNATKAATQYLKIAEEHGLTLAQLSLAFVTQQPFVTSTIIGATTMNQLKENIESIEVTLNDDILKQINAVHNDIPNPAV
ncbi:NADP(H)-dependent aldo-keto reductase [Neotamlana sedimentorum]|nr:NADP(H)-dependent aldo-keto reductase [Tamlana sedimentorum]